MNKIFFSIGLMSGTSLDGVDASIIKSDGEQFFEIIDDIYIKYTDKLKSELENIINLCSTKEQFNLFSMNIKKIEKELTLYHIRACKLILSRNKKIKIDLIGFHGQTILHKPKKKYSIQIGDSLLLAKKTKIKVISNFRENDILNGGEGAPLAPLYHKLIINKIKSKQPSVVVNIGGIANITYVDKKNELISFDTGPGNYLIDQWVQKNTKKMFDKNGLMANSGHPNNKLISKFLNNKYYKKKYPKSLDVKDFSLKIFNKLNFLDGCATLSMITAKSISMGIQSFNKKPKIILITGGGRKNTFIIKSIERILKTSVHLVDDFNFKGDFMESQAFAYLAIRSYLNKSITYPNTTGVKKACTGGNLFEN